MPEAGRTRDGQWGLVATAIFCAASEQDGSGTHSPGPHPRPKGPVYTGVWLNIRCGTEGFASQRATPGSGSLTLADAPPAPPMRKQLNL